MQVQDSSDSDFGHSPAPGTSMQKDSTSGTLRTKITLVGNKPVVVCPFYLMKDDLPTPAPLVGSTDLLAYYGLDHAYAKYCTAKKLKKDLSSFLSHLPGNLDVATKSGQDDSSLRSLIEKPPVMKPINPLSTTALQGFRLQPGPIPEQYRVLPGGEEEKKRHKKKHKRKAEDDGAGKQEEPTAKRVKTDEETEKPKKKKKKDKKKKSKVQSPVKVEDSGVLTF